MPEDQANSPFESIRTSFSPDRAIRRAVDDELGRGKFAARLAEAICRCDPREGLVIGLSGPWGCGKTSVKNMVLEGLPNFGATCPDKLEFNPWQISDQEQITLNFFRELLAKLNTERGDPKKTMERATALAKYASYLSVTSNALKTAGVLLPILSLAGVAGDAASDALRKGAEATTAQAATQDESLGTLREKLQGLFADLQRPLLVVIDDIDRLNAKEIPQILQLVKANADFPQVIYLLLYDKHIVEKALDAVSDNKGKEFLEKIVQVSFDIPKVAQSKIDQLLFAGIENIIGSLTVQRYWDKRRWSIIYPEHLQYYFPNLRAVRRFLASFGFQIDLIRKPGNSACNVLEINPLDLIALECIRLFEPSSLYSSLGGLKEILTGGSGNHIFASDSDQEEVDRVISGVLGKR